MVAAEGSRPARRVEAGVDGDVLRVRPGAEAAGALHARDALEQGGVPGRTRIELSSARQGRSWPQQAALGVGGGSAFPAGMVASKRAIRSHGR
jgi:hypothetical protein